MLPVVLLSSSAITISRRSLARLLAAAIAFPLIMALAAPCIAMITHTNETPTHVHYKQLAQQIEEFWRARTASPIPILGGDVDLVNGTAFYLHGRATAYFILAPALSPWVTEARIGREGITLVCPAEARACVEALNARSAQAGVAATDIRLVRSYLGVPGHPARYVISAVPPNASNN